jgi:hypothetical protein
MFTSRGDACSCVRPLAAKKKKAANPKSAMSCRNPKIRVLFTVLHDVQKDTPNLDGGFTKSSHKDKLDVNSPERCGVGSRQSWAVAQFKLFPAQGML